MGVKQGGKVSLESCPLSSLHLLSRILWSTREHGQLRELTVSWSLAGQIGRESVVHEESETIALESEAIVPLATKEVSFLSFFSQEWRRVRNTPGLHSTLYITGQRSEACAVFLPWKAVKTFCIPVSGHSKWQENHGLLPRHTFHAHSLPFVVNWPWRDGIQNEGVISFGTL